MGVEEASSPSLPSRPAYCLGLIKEAPPTPKWERRQLPPPCVLPRTYKGSPSTPPCVTHPPPEGVGRGGVFEGWGGASTYAGGEGKEAGRPGEQDRESKWDLGLVKGTG